MTTTLRFSQRRVAFLLLLSTLESVFEDGFPVPEDEDYRTFGTALASATSLHCSAEISLLGKVGGSVRPSIDHEDLKDMADRFSKSLPELSGHDLESEVERFRHDLFSFLRIE